MTPSAACIAPGMRGAWFRSVAHVAQLTKGAAASPVRISSQRTQIGRGSTRRAQFGVLERGALGPPRRPGEFVEEPEVVGAFRRLAHHFVDLVSVRPDENAP